jgi:hypothetical protein
MQTTTSTVQHRDSHTPASGVSSGFTHPYARCAARSSPSRRSPGTPDKPRLLRERSRVRCSGSASANRPASIRFWRFFRCSPAVRLSRGLQCIIHSTQLHSFRENEVFFIIPASRARATAARHLVATQIPMPQTDGDLVRHASHAGCSPEIVALKQAVSE